MGAEGSREDAVDAGELRKELQNADDAGNRTMDNRMLWALGDRARMRWMLGDRVRDYRMRKMLAIGRWIIGCGECWGIPRGCGGYWGIARGITGCGRCWQSDDG